MCYGLVSGDTTYEGSQSSRVLKKGDHHSLKRSVQAIKLYTLPITVKRDLAGLVVSIISPNHDLQFVENIRALSLI